MSFIHTQSTWGVALLQWTTTLVLPSRAGDNKNSTHSGRAEHTGNEKGEVQKRGGKGLNRQAKKYSSYNRTQHESPRQSGDKPHQMLFSADTTLSKAGKWKKIDFSVEEESFSLAEFEAVNFQMFCLDCPRLQLQLLPCGCYGAVPGLGTALEFPELQPEQDTAATQNETLQTVQQVCAPNRKRKGCQQTKEEWNLCK